MAREGILFVISGPSGVGKGTLRESLLAASDNLCYSISSTTRKPRDGEQDGYDYNFIDVPAFEKMIQHGDLLEWAVVYDNYYGTSRKFVLDKLKQGMDVLLEIDIQGAMQVKNNFPEGVFIFIMPPSREALEERLTARGKDTPEQIARRLACYEEEISHVLDYEYMVINEDRMFAVEALAAIIKAERCKVSRNILRGD